MWAGLGMSPPSTPWDHFWTDAEMAVETAGLAGRVADAYLIPIEERRTTHEGPSAPAGTPELPG